MIFPESWLRDYCDPPLNASEISNLLTMAGLEVEDVRPLSKSIATEDVNLRSSGSENSEAENIDNQFILKLTPNFGHALSIIGLARELSAITGKGIEKCSFQNFPVAAKSATPLINIIDSDLCGRFVGRVVNGIDARTSTPKWIKDRLLKCGYQTVNILVDISNYVMLEYGCPSHIFDLSKINGDLTVRWARSGEVIRVANGKELKLTKGIGVVSDDSSPISVAGIISGERASASNSTKDIFIEVAYWWPEAIAGRDKKIGISTDASYRFERGVDPQSLLNGIERLTQLIIKYCSGTVGPVTDLSPNLPKRIAICLRMSRLKKILGITVTKDRCIQIFLALGFSVISEKNDAIVIMPPSWRFDIKIEEDLIGEVARFVDYDPFLDMPPLASVKFTSGTEGNKSLHKLRQKISNLGYLETINYSFVKKEWEFDVFGNTSLINLLNPISENMAVMRSNLIVGLIGGVKRNIDRQASRVRLFEIGRVFISNPLATSNAFGVHGIDQPIKVAGIAYGSVDPIRWDEPEKAVGFFDIKGDLEAIFSPIKPDFSPAQHPALHPGRSATITIDGNHVGIVGEIHPRLRQFFDLPSSPIVFELQTSSLCHRNIPKFSTIPRQQSIWRDISLRIDPGVSYESIKNTILSMCISDLIHGVQLFDLYKEKKMRQKPKGDVYMALRIELRDEKSTLTEERIEKIINEVLCKLRHLGVELRGKSQ